MLKINSEEKIRKFLKSKEKDIYIFTKTKHDRYLIHQLAEKYNLYSVRDSITTHGIFRCKTHKKICKTARDGTPGCRFCTVCPFDDDHCDKVPGCHTEFCGVRVSKTPNKSSKRHGRKLHKQKLNTINTWLRTDFAKNLPKFVRVMFRTKIIEILCRNISF